MSNRQLLTSRSLDYHPLRRRHLQRQNEGHSCDRLQRLSSGPVLISWSFCTNWQLHPGLLLPEARTNSYTCWKRHQLWSVTRRLLLPDEDRGPNPMSSRHLQPEHGQIFSLTLPDMYTRKLLLASELGGCGGSLSSWLLLPYRNQSEIPYHILRCWLQMTRRQQRSDSVFGRDVPKRAKTRYES